VVWESVAMVTGAVVVATVTEVVSAVVVAEMTNARDATRCSRRAQTSPPVTPVPPPGELDQTYSSSYSLHCVKT